MLFPICKHRPLPASPALSFFLQRQEDFSAEDDLDLVLRMFCRLDDYDVMTAVKMWYDDEDFVLRELCRRLIDRHLFRIEQSPEPFDPDYIDRILHAIAEKYAISLYDASFMLLQGLSTNHAYQLNKPAINILFKDGSVKDISEASDQFNTEVLTQPVFKHFICYPKELEF